MITVKKELGKFSDSAEFELAGLSTDLKPTNRINGKKIGVNSLMLELDTGDIYYFTGSAWSKFGGDN